MINSRGYSLSRSQRERGDGLVELAIILPVLMLMLIAILDLGRAVYAYSVVANCAREGARYGVIYPDSTSAIVAVVHNAAVGLDPAQMTVAVDRPGASTIQVDVQYKFTIVT
ncbi:MAG: pilus assembly protein, partial [Chloroflexi bacterium]|nr:pilus assembly protein [Chloroflexota bacterium]